jgi:hypothetical protein
MHSGQFSEIPLSKTIVLSSNHNDASGGGRYVLQLAKCLQQFCNAYFAGDL